MKYMNDGISIAVASLAIALAAFVAAVAMPALTWGAMCTFDELGGANRGWDLSDLTESRPFRALEAVCALGVVACVASIAVLWAVALGMRCAL